MPTLKPSRKPTFVEEELTPLREWAGLEYRELTPRRARILMITGRDDVTKEFLVDLLRPVHPGQGYEWFLETSQEAKAFRIMLIRASREAWPPPGKRSNGLAYPSYKTDIIEGDGGYWVQTMRRLSPVPIRKNAELLAQDEAERDGETPFIAGKPRKITTQ